MSEELAKLVRDVVAESHNRTAAEMDIYILQFFGGEAKLKESAHLYVLEVSQPSGFETMISRDFEDLYKIRMTSRYRIRRKTKEELEAEEMARDEMAAELDTASQELHGL